MSTRSIVIHGHFYQPPRENPWLEEVEREASAAPHHDWNARIEQECYRAVVAARVLAPNGRIASIVNTLEYISFNFGPTLLEWMEHAAPDTYARVLDADRKSVTRLGHGNAIAQPYHHAILPLSSRRDKVTEVRWGIADFKRRFGRDPEGMWLPETAIDDETLDVLAQEGMKFTIVAPGQVRSVPNDGHPGRYTTSNGRSIALCIYDGDISHGIAFGGLLGDANVWEKRLLARTDRRRTPSDRDVIEPGHWEPDPQSDGGTRPLTTGEMFAITTSDEPARRGLRHRLVSAATDGETYGHHHRFAEMALARVVTDLPATRGVVVENFASYLANHGCTHDVEIVAPSAWSCAHGVERWRSNCSCRMRGDTNQEWRTPLREAITELAEGIHAIYEREGKRYFADPWAVRDAYGEVVATPERIGEWVQARMPPNAGEHTGAESRLASPASPVASPQSLLDMERGALRIFTSCAWFFDDIGGLEPLEVLRYAARAIELAGADGAALEERFLARLATAISNDPAVGTGRDLYLRAAKPNVSQFARLAASVAAARAIAPADAEALLTSAALRVEASNGTVAVQQLRAGQRDAFEVTVSGAVDGERASVREPVVAHIVGSRPVALPVSEMTERQRAVIARGMRRQLLRTAFGPNVDVAAEPIDGDRVDTELVNAITLLGHDRSESLTNRVTALLDLLELESRQVPFDAQTRFHDAFLGANRREWLPAEISAIAHRLGFA
jgi:hypothetical protein